MSSFLGALEHPDFLQVMWFFPVAYALHEAEEWNIMRWYARNLFPSSSLATPLPEALLRHGWGKSAKRDFA